MGFKDRFKDIEPVIETVKETEEKVQRPELEYAKRQLSDKISNIPVWFEYTDDEKNELIKTFLDNSDINITEDEKTLFLSELAACVYGFGELDILLGDKSVSSIAIKGCNPVIAERGGVQITTDVRIEKIRALKDRLLKLSGEQKNSGVVKFAYKNLIITVILPPVSETYIYIKKKNRKTTDFEYLLQNNKIDENIYAFLISVLNEKKNILISGCTNSGKTSYVEAFLGAISNYALLQENYFIERESFVCGKLNDDEFENLVEVVNHSGNEYIVCDLNNGFFNFENHSLISTVRAESVNFAITKLTGNEISRRSYSEKQAKAKIAEVFDYIIQLDSEMHISSITELSLNKAGSLVVNEILKRSENEYSYDL